MKYNDSYFNGKNRPITIENNLEIGMVLPIRYDSETIGDVTVVKAKEE